MPHTSPALPPRVGLRVGHQTRDAVPVLLRGNEAALVMDDTPQEEDHCCLLLDWDDGRVTSLDVRVRAVDGERQIAHMDVYRVNGDWRPFLDYLALTAA
jgi:hypothetical protein